MRGSCASCCASGISFNPTSHLNFSDSFQLEEKPWANENSFHYPENPFPKPEWGILLKNTFLLDGKHVSPTMDKLPLARIFFKNWILPNF